MLHDAEVARLAVHSARDRAVHRLRIGYMPASLPAALPRALHRLTTSMANLATSLHPGTTTELIDAVRGRHLDAAVISLPAPTGELRTTALGVEYAIAALPVAHRHATAPAIRLDQMQPDRIIVLPREANRALYDAILTACHQGHLSPTLHEMTDGHLEPALLAVASGTGMALLPASAAERYLAPGVRFVALADPQPTVTVAVISRRDTTHLPTAAFLRAITHAAPRTPATRTTAAAAA